MEDLAGKYRRSRRWNVVLGAIGVFLGIVVAAQALPSQSPTAASPTEAATTDEEAAEGYQELDFVRRDLDDPMALGDVDAPVVMTEWVDLRCPFCASYSRETLPTLIEDYVDTGKVRLEFHDVAYFGEESADAAVAARAAGRQDRYVEYMTAVFDAAPDGGHPDMPREKLIGFAETAGVPDIEQFTEDLDDPELRAELDASQAKAQQLGVTAVPFFIAGNTAVSGAQPLPVFQEFLDEVVAQTDDGTE